MLFLKKSKLLAFSFTLLFTCFIHKQIKAQCHIDDWTALKAFYNSTSGDYWYDNTGWETVKENSIPLDCDLEKLFGVKLDEDGRVHSLVLEFLVESRFKASLPPELGNLTNLTILDIRRTPIAGNIPPELGNLTNLTTLHLERNRINGYIPPEIGNLVKLINLNIINNNIRGNVPAEIGNLAKLTDLRLYGNDLSGSIPPEIGNLVNLTYLELGWNRLSGSIPAELGSLTNLTDLRLYGNELSGNILPELGNLTNLINLDLKENQLNGSIPPELSSLTNLNSLNIGNNQLNGSIPSELGNLSNLTVLKLEGNQLTGNIPTELSNLTKLIDLDLGQNQLNGNLPAELGKLTNLNNMWLYENELNGSIPPEFSNLTNLIDLVLSNNKLSGSIPAELGNLANLAILALGNNQLSGCYDESLAVLCDQLASDNIFEGNNFKATWKNFCKIGVDACLVSQCNMDDWAALKALYESTDGDNWSSNYNWELVKADSPPTDCNLNHLEKVRLGINGRVVELNLSSNRLNGSIPPELGNMTHLIELYLSDNELSGSIPSKIGNLTNLPELNLSYNQLSGSIPPELGNLTNLTELELFNNQLSGSIPSEIGSLTNLINLELFDNQLSGSIPLELGNLTSLTNLNLSENELTSLSPELGKLTNLTNLNLSKNKLSGNIPPELGNLNNLNYLRLQGNNLSGNISPEFGSLINLQELDLSDNQLSSNIPPEVGNLINLRSLILFNNQLTGSIPIELIDLTNLYNLLLFNNQLSGCYGENLAVLCDRFGSNQISEGNNFEASWDNFCNVGVEACSVSKCDFDDWTALKTFYENTNGNNWTVNQGWDLIKGEAPPIECNLGNLYGVSLNETGRVHSLVLHKNQLKGKISSELVGLTNLTRLELQSNNLSGNIPPELGNLPNLAIIRLHENNLSGTIPNELGNLTNLTFLSLYENQLSGKVPIELDNSNQFSGLELYSNYFSCADFQDIFKFRLFDMKHYNYGPQLYKPTNYDSISINIFDSIAINHQLAVDIPFDTTGFTYQWLRNGNAIPSANQAILNLDTIQPQNAGAYTLQLINENCLPDGRRFTTNSEPIYIIFKGYDLYGQPVEYDQIMVEFDNAEDTKQYEDEILTPNAGWVKEACNCNRELYLWQFPSTEAAVQALIEIDRKWKRLKGRNKAKGGFNNNISIGETDNKPIAYNILSDAYSESYTDSTLIFLLDSGLDIMQDNFTLDEAPVDQCYDIESSTGYTYVDSVATITTDYSDELWHGTFGYHSITEYLKDESAFKIVPLKIFDKSGKGNLFDMVCALNHAIDHNADIVNISAGYYGEPSEILESAINYAREKGIFITAAAGNDTTNIDSIPQYPAYYSSQYNIFETVDPSGVVKFDSVKYDNVISVASINVNDELSQFSNTGKRSVTIACYGENISGYGVNDLAIVASGTSMSTFLATKALALEIAKDKRRDYKQVWNDFENNWLVSNPTLINVTQTGKHVDFMAKDITTNIEDTNTGFEMHPNPTNGMVQLAFLDNSTLPKQIFVVDFLGKSILSINSSDKVIKLNLKEYPVGVYFVRIDTGKETVIRKLILK